MGSIVLTASACSAEDPLAIADVSVETFEATPGVAVVRFTTSIASPAGVRVEGPGVVFETPSDGGGTDHSIEVRGLILGEQHTLIPVADGVDGPPETLAVASPRADFPVFDRTVWEPDRSCGDGYLLTTFLTLDDRSFVAILDREGRPVWAQAGPEDQWAARVRPSRDGSGLVWLHHDPDRQQDVGAITRVAWTGEVVSETRAREANHDFVELPEGGFAWLSYVYAPQTLVDGVVRDVVTDALLEAPEGGADEDAVEVFSMLEDFPPGLYDPGTKPTEFNFVPGWWEFAHANSLVVDDAGQDFHVMFRWLDALIEVDRATGTQTWQLGGRDSDFTGPDGERFTHGHLSEVWDGGFLVFDNADDSAGVSGVAEYAVDEQARTWDRVFDRRDPAGKLELLLGDAIRFPGCDHRLAAWSTSARVEELTADGEVVWSLQGPAGWIVGRITWLPDLYGG